MLLSYTVNIVNIRIPKLSKPRPFLATILAVALTSCTLSAPALAEPSNVPEHGSAEIRTVEFEQPLGTDQLTSIKLPNDMIALDYSVGAAFGSYVYDPAQTLSSNLNSLKKLVYADFKTQPVIVRITYLEKPEKKPRTASTIAKAASRLPEPATPKPDYRHFQRVAHGTATTTQKQVTPTNSTWKPDSNRIKIQNGPLSGHRLISAELSWHGKGHPSNLPDNWGFEFKVHQQMRSATDQKTPAKTSLLKWPACGAYSDGPTEDPHPDENRWAKENFWANPKAQGATFSILINGQSKPDPRNSDVEQYIDTNLLLDDCNKGSIGFGIGKPKKIGKTQFPDGETASLLAVMRPKSASKNRIFVEVQVKAVDTSTCLGRANSDCTNLKRSTAKTPASEYQILLNKTRRWEAPTCFIVGDGTTPPTGDYNSQYCNKHAKSYKIN